MMMSFWDMQLFTINALTKLGFKYALRDRLPIFRVWLRLNKLASKRGISREAIDQAREGLNGLMQFKHADMEPPFKGTRYLKDENDE